MRHTVFRIEQNPAAFEHPLQLLLGQTGLEPPRFRSPVVLPHPLIKLEGKPAHGLPAPKIRDPDPGRSHSADMPTLIDEHHLFTQTRR